MVIRSCTYFTPTCWSTVHRNVDQCPPNIVSRSQPQTPNKFRAARRKVGTHTSSSAHTYKSHAHVFVGHDGATALACVGNDDRRLRASAGSIPNEQPTAKSVDCGNFTTANFTQNSLKAGADCHWGRLSSSSASDCAIPVGY